MALSGLNLLEEAALRVASSEQTAAQGAAAALARVWRGGTQGGSAPLSEARKVARSSKGPPLLVANNRAGYFGVCCDPRKSKPFEARVRRDGKEVSLGKFATAEAAALCVAGTPEGKEAAVRAAAAPISLTSGEARQMAQAEGLTLRVAKNSTGFAGVCIDLARKIKPYSAQVKCQGKLLHLGRYATPEEASLRLAQSSAGRAAVAQAERAAAAPPIPFMTSEEAHQLAQAEGLTLRVANNATGFFCVRLDQNCRKKPHQAQMYRVGKKVSLGYYVTAEEAALAVARSPEGQVLQAAAHLAAAAVEQEHKIAVSEEEGAVDRPKKKAKR